MPEDQTEDFQIPDADPTAGQEPPLLPEGRYGEQGEAELIRLRHIHGTSDKGNEYSFMVGTVKIVSDEHGIAFADCGGPGGPGNWNLQGQSGSSWPEHAQNLGIVPGQAASELVPLKVIVDVTQVKDRQQRRQDGKKLQVTGMWKG